MSTITPEVLDDWFSEWEIIDSSKGDQAAKKACPMSLLSLVNGGPFTDHPDCAHKIITELVIRTVDNNELTDDERKDIVRAGLTGALDTWDIPTEVVVMAHAWTGTGPDDRTPLTRCLDVLGAITWWKHDKQRPCLSGADLTRANLSGADLTGANLSGAYLSGADLSWAYLSGADLTGANLTRANLSRAYLSGADLSGADLTRANLSGADLTGANLSGADLSRANLSGADLLHLARNVERAHGDRFTRLPAGWSVDEASGLIRRPTEVAS